MLCFHFPVDLFPQMLYIKHRLNERMNGVIPLANEFGNDIITLEDENGVVHTFEVLDAIDDGEKRYLALSPIYDSAEDMLEDSADLVIMQVCEDNGEEYLETIEDEDELDEIADIFMKRLEQEYDFDDEEEVDE